MTEEELMELDDRPMMARRLSSCCCWSSRVLRMTPVVVAKMLIVLLSIGLELAVNEGVDATKGAFSQKSDSTNEYCSGYTDKHGQWNNGFSCPKWGRPDQIYCCGPEHHRYCCPRQRETQSDAANGFQSNGPLLAGLTVAALLTMTFLLVASCYCCPCCVIYKRRKSRIPDRSSDSIDWQLGATTPIRYEMAASSVSTSSNIDLRPSNPPPYDDRDAPPKYSAVCDITDHPIPYNGSCYPRPNASHSNSTEPATQVFAKKQFDVIGQSNHVIGKHCKQVPATRQQSHVIRQQNHLIGQRTQLVDDFIGQNSQAVFSRVAYEPGRTTVDAGVRPEGYESSALLSHAPVGVRGGTIQNHCSYPHLRDDRLSTANSSR